MNTNIYQGINRYPFSMKIKEDPYRYSVFRCPDPVAVKTGQPWYPNQNYCPCDPSLSNFTGRGFTPCPFGIQSNFNQIQNTIDTNLKPLTTLVSSIDNKTQRFQVSEQPVSDFTVFDSSLFPLNNYTPPQFQPRQLARIGQEWRSAQN